MKACVFLGPSLRRDEAERLAGAIELRPPVRAGDVRQALHDGCNFIGIVDGFFEQVPTVWHKEILFAMSRGAWVYGGGSMGALRAAELHRYGMVGIGTIFEAYRSGQFEADDEVAVVHAPADSGFRELSTALANLRFGLRRAVELGVISAASEAALLAAAQRRFYADRSWKALFLDGKRENSVDREELVALEAWVMREPPNQKRDDAIAVLNRMTADLAAGLAPFSPAFAFEPTEHWDLAERAFLRRVGR
jgi:hypothetical protein